MKIITRLIDLSNSRANNSPRVPDGLSKSVGQRPVTGCPSKSPYYYVTDFYLIAILIIVFRTLIDSLNDIQINESPCIYPAGLSVYGISNRV